MATGVGWAPDLFNSHGSTRNYTEKIFYGIYSSVFFRVLPWQKNIRLLRMGHYQQETAILFP